MDVEKADQVIGSAADLIRSTFSPEVLGKFGGFAAAFRPDWTRYHDPVLFSATDGVGTKLKIAFLTGVHDTVGIDLVAMNVNDILVHGAQPLFFLDYFATGSIEPGTIRSVLAGIVNGCRLAGCALIGGETAEMPDFYAAGEYDLAGFCVGIADKAKICDGTGMIPGDAVLGLGSSGLHSNGFSLVRKALLEKEGYSVDAFLEDLGKPLGDELLTPTSIYVKPVLKLIEDVPVRAMAHITGGGFFGNIPRVLPDSCSVIIRSGAWPIPPIFHIVRRATLLDNDEMFRTFNMGIGFVLVVPADCADRAVDMLRRDHVPARIVGEVVSRSSQPEPFKLV